MLNFFHKGDIVKHLDVLLEIILAILALASYLDLESYKQLLGGF